MPKAAAKANESELEIAQRLLNEKGDAENGQQAKTAIREMLNKAFPDTAPRVIDKIILDEEFSYGKFSSGS